MSISCPKHLCNVEGHTKHSLPNHSEFEQRTLAILSVYINILTEGYLKNVVHGIFFFENTQHINKTQFSSFPPSALLLLEGRGHRGRVKVASERRGVGLGLSKGGGRQGGGGLYKN